jgi:hypothetical protein
VSNERFYRMSLSQLLVDMYLETNTVIAKNCNSFSAFKFKTVLVNLLLFLRKCNIWKRMEKGKLELHVTSVVSEVETQ